MRYACFQCCSPHILIGEQLPTPSRPDMRSCPASGPPCVQRQSIQLKHGPCAGSSADPPKGQDTDNIDMRAGSMRILSREACRLPGQSPNRVLGGATKGFVCQAVAFHATRSIGGNFTGPASAI